MDKGPGSHLVAFLSYLTRAMGKTSCAMGVMVMSCPGSHLGPLVTRAVARTTWANGQRSRQSFGCIPVLFDARDGQNQLRDGGNGYVMSRQSFGTPFDAR